MHLTVAFGNFRRELGDEAKATHSDLAHMHRRKLSAGLPNFSQSLPAVAVITTRSSDHFRIDTFASFLQCCMLTQATVQPLSQEPYRSN